MVSTFALDLTGGSVRLFRTINGSDWEMRCEIALPDPDLPAELRAAVAAEAADPRPAAHVRVPADQIAQAEVALPSEMSGETVSGDPPVDVVAALMAAGHTVGPGDRLASWHDGEALRSAVLPGPVVAELEGFLSAIGLRLACVTVPVETSADAPWFLSGAWQTPPVAPTWDAGEDAPRGPWPATPRDRALAAARSVPPPDAPIPDLLDDPEIERAKALLAERLLRRARQHDFLRFGPGLRRVAGMTAVLVVAVVATLFWAVERSAETDDPVARMAGLPERDQAPAPPDPVAEPRLDPAGRDSASHGAAQSDAVVALGPSFYTPPTGLDETLPVATLDTFAQPGIDPEFRADALALPARAAIAEAPVSLPDPAPAGETFVVDADGFILPSAEGRRAPEGYTVYSGRPPLMTRPRPEREPQEAVNVVERASLAADDPLRTLTPQPRPSNLVARQERARLGGRTVAELALRPPERRPETAQSGVSEAPSALARNQGPRPQMRTDAARRAFTAARTAAAPDIRVVRNTTGVRTVAATPSAPAADAAVSRGTSDIDLRDVSLLGTYGKRGAQRALVRLPSGRVINLSVGDRVDGGKVARIVEGRLEYVKAGRTHTLRMPRG